MNVRISEIMHICPEQWKQLVSLAVSATVLTIVFEEHVSFHSVVEF